MVLGQQNHRISYRYLLLFHLHRETWIKSEGEVK